MSNRIEVPGWRALVNDWTDAVRRYDADPEGAEDRIARIVFRHGGEVEDTGGIGVGTIRFDGAYATVSADLLALWDGDADHYEDFPIVEIHAEEVAG